MKTRDKRESRKGNLMQGMCERYRSGFQAWVYQVSSHHPCVNYMRVYLSVIYELRVSDRLTGMHVKNSRSWAPHQATKSESIGAGPSHLQFKFRTHFFHWVILRHIHFDLSHFLVVHGA